MSLFPHDLSQAEQFGADVKLLPPRRFHVDLQANVAVVDLKLIIPPAAAKLLAFLPPSAPRSSQPLREQGSQTLALRGADKNDLASGGLLGIGDLAHLKRPAAQRFPRHRLSQRVAEGILAQHSDHDRVGRDS